MPNIPANMMKAVKSEKTGNIILLGRMMYANLYNPAKPSKNESDPKKFTYQNSILIPAGFDLSALEAEVTSVFHANVVEAKRATTKWKRPPIYKTSEQGSVAGFADEYPTFVKASSRAFDRNGKPRMAPDVVNAQGQAVPAGDEAKETYNGRWCRMSVNPFWYDNDDKGVTLGLINVQLLWHDDPLAGGKVKASSEFEAVDDGELAGMEDFQ
jgi:hypothetical protein